MLAHVGISTKKPAELFWPGTLLCLEVCVVCVPPPPMSNAVAVPALGSSPQPISFRFQTTELDKL